MVRVLFAGVLDWFPTVLRTSLILVSSTDELAVRGLNRIYYIVPCALSYSRQ